MPRAGTTVILIDDDAFILEVAMAVLTAEFKGLEVAAFVTAEDALAAEDSGQPALILLDLMLPGMDGLEAAPALQDRYGETVPIVALTAKSADGLDENLDRAGFAGLIRKPFVRSDFAKQLQPYLETTG